MKKISKDIAVSSIISTILLLGISTSVFSGLYFSIISKPVPSFTPMVEISGIYMDNQIILTHRLGDPINISSKVELTIGGETKNVTIGDYLDDEAKKNGFWDFSEEFIYSISYDFNYSKYPNIGVDVVNLDSNSLVFEGKITEANPVGDLDISLDTGNHYPNKGDTITFNITACNNGNVNATNVIVNFTLPDELKHVSNITKKGSYANNTGIWEIDIIPAEECVELQIDAVVADTGSSKYTQLILILDGSGSIKADDFILQKDGLIEAIKNPDVFPHNDKVELSIIQFGGPTDNIRAEIEIDPIIVNEKNIDDIINNTDIIDQLTGYTPTDSGIYNAADTLYKSLNNPKNGGIYERQVIIIVTDGDPTACCNNLTTYSAVRSVFVSCDAKSSAEDARDYLINKLNLNIDEEDQINVIAVGDSNKYSTWMKNEIAWPETGYFAPPFILDKPYYGWVRNVSTYQEFASSIDELFGIIFNKIIISSVISSDFLIDPTDINNEDDVIIVAYDN